ncbi:hypothetical protein [Mesonia aquimarina]|uniref:hypothetical protein n=1 Tax=Mesonia aquimarina TaxID=1504967 RepID=UPI000EF5D65A|nr:hypothetical protein [Mesonia aquimarina]
MKTSLLIILISFNLLFGKAYGQNGEFLLRKEFIGKIIKDPENADIKYLLEQYALKLDSVWENQNLPLWHCRRNCLDVKFENNKDVLIEYERAKLENLRKEVFNFLLNPSQETTKSDARVQHFSNGKKYPVSTGLVFVTYDQEINNNVLHLFKEIARGIADYKYYLANEIFCLDYSELNKKHKDELDSTVNWRIISSNFFPPPPPPPPPPPSFDSLKSK